MSLNKTVFDFLKTLNLTPHQTILVGLSGGPDSVALLSILNQHKAFFNYQLIATHLDHQWREHSYQDVLFCQTLCDQLQIKFICKKASELPNLKNISQNGSKEALGRNLRRALFTQVANDYGASYIALGHHLDDQIETFFIRLIRGSSLSGLGGMQIQNDLYIRPFLNISKTEILAYLEQHNLSYVIDSTNESDLFLRNKIRKLLPKITNLDTRFKPNLVKTISKIQATNHFVTKLAQAELNKISSNQALNLKLFSKLDPFLQNEVLLQWLYQHPITFTQTTSLINEILRFFNSPHGGTHQVASNWQIVKKQNLVKIIVL